MPAGEYVAWLAVNADGGVAGGAGLLARTVLPFPTGEGVGSGREALVINVYVEPDYRRLGIARRLMDALVSWSREAGIERIALHASPHGRHLYDTMGFIPTNEMRLMLTGSS